MGFAAHIDPPTGHIVVSTFTPNIAEQCAVDLCEPYKASQAAVVFERFGGLWGWVLDNPPPLLLSRGGPPAEHPPSLLDPGSSWILSTGPAYMVSHSPFRNGL